ncbi:MAG: TIGR00266 family protein [Candidatus Hodarchaeales archaeon]
MSERSNVRYEIEGRPAFAVVKVYLDPGQRIIAEGGAMVYMDGHVDMETKSTGGVLKGLKRKFSGESMFQNHFAVPEGSNDPGMIAFAHGSPGDIIHLHLEGGEQWTLNRDAYICSTPGLEVTTSSGGFKSMFGGEGLFLTQINALEEGDFWFGGYGLVERHDLAPGREFVIDTGVMMAYTTGIQYKLSKVGGRKSFVLGGEGIVMRFTGPGVVYTQNREISLFASLLLPYLPVTRG